MNLNIEKQHDKEKLDQSKKDKLNDRINDNSADSASTVGNISDDHIKNNEKNNLNKILSKSGEQDSNKKGRKKVKRPDAANEVIAIEKRLGIKNDLILKANMYSLVGLILVVCGLSAPVFVLVGIVAEGLSIKVMLSSDYRRQKLWHKCIIHYAKGMYNQAKAFSTRLPEEDRNGEAYKIFMNMVDSAINAGRA